MRDQHLYKSRAIEVYDHCRLLLPWMNVPSWFFLQSGVENLLVMVWTNNLRSLFFVRYLWPLIHGDLVLILPVSLKVVCGVFEGVAAGGFGPSPEILSVVGEEKLHWVIFLTSDFRLRKMLDVTRARSSGSSIYGRCWERVGVSSIFIIK